MIPVGLAFQLDPGHHPGPHLVDDRLVELGDDLHVLEVGEVEQGLMLPDGHPFLDDDLPAGVVRVDDEAVVRGPDRTRRRPAAPASRVDSTCRCERIR